MALGWFSKKNDGISPQENLPRIGTVEGPALFRHREDEVLLSYEIAPVDGGGNVILAFSKVVYFEQNPNNVHEGLANSKYPVRMWDITEVPVSDRTERWSCEFHCHRFWTISFNDWMIEIVFSSVRKVHEDREQISPDAALLNYMISLR
ncbi:hypothetical protein [Sphingopyxis sp. KK2]|uniref:hypothetical protein n=1 Tax=Sphingopyxis sp. KK2 TaxID=1855727 RepID=UPI001181BC2F|nr:hypothetical protein [Sphingopyxis sp. KK2]